MYRGRDYSAIEHLARTLYLGDDWQHQPYAMLSAHYDKTQAGGFLYVAGYVSEVGRWTAFDKAWKAFLRRPEYNVRYFHMVEFAHSRKEFKNGWKGEHQKRREFLAGLIEIIQEHAFYGFAHGVRLKEFDAVFTSRLSPDEPLSHPFAYCGRHCMNLALKWALQEGWTLPMRSVFERGDDGWGMLVKAAMRDGHPKPLDEPKKPQTPEDDLLVLTPLQAADFAAYEVMKFAKLMDDDGDWEDVRQSCKALTIHPPCKWQIAEPHDLESSFKLNFNRL